MTKNIWRDGMYGLIVGDALGVPVEFSDRSERKEDPVMGMRAYGTHNQPAGTWSDDSSMALATLDSIREKGELDYDDIMQKFSDWCLHGIYTPFNDVFDIGISTSRAILNYGRGEKAEECGGKTEWDNGNGSLMRILPVCLYLFELQKTICTSEDASIYHIHTASGLTHGHIRSQIACGIFYFCVKAILEGEGSLTGRLQRGMDHAFAYYRRDFSNYTDVAKFFRMADLEEFKKTSEDDIKSSGYVVDSLEAAIWCLITTETYAEAVLKAVNLGSDTDTVGAITGALAGLYYGEENIPQGWMDVIQGKDLIEEILGDEKISGN